jgi:RHS repeat-associated protein
MAGPQGERLIEVNGGFNLLHYNVFWEGKLLGTFSGSAAVQTNWHFSLNDWLGTKRVTTTSTGANWTSIFSGPFGDYQSQAGTGSDPSEEHFTGKPRDPNSNLDYFGARYYNSNLGRFMSPDFNETGDGPDPVPYADLENPQSLNLYSYVKNNPLSRTDANGHATLCGPDTWNPQTNTLTAGSCVDLSDPETDRQIIRQWVYQHTTTAPRNQQVPRMVSSNSNIKWDPLSLLYGVGGTLSPKAKQTLDKLNKGDPLPDGQRAGAEFKNDGSQGAEKLPDTDADGNPITYNMTLNQSSPESIAVVSASAGERRQHLRDN